MSRNNSPDCKKKLRFSDTSTIIMIVPKTSTEKKVSFKIGLLGWCCLKLWAHSHFAYSFRRLGMTETPYVSLRRMRGSHLACWMEPVTRSRN